MTTVGADGIPPPPAAGGAVIVTLALLALAGQLAGDVQVPLYVIDAVPVTWYPYP